MSTPEGHVPIDTELSGAVLALLSARAGVESYELLVGHFVRVSAEDLLARAQALISEFYSVPVTAQGITVGEECRRVAAVFEPRHPELSEEALDALRHRYMFENR